MNNIFTTKIIGNKSIDNLQINKLSIDIYHNIRFIEFDYPGFSNWYFSKVIEDLYSGDREILLLLNNQELAGISILKNSVEEKKICTFRIVEKYQKSGLGKSLIEKSLMQLNCDKPLITVPQKHFYRFNKLLNSFDFELSEVKNSFYTKESKEYIYNGVLK